jgi:hypothetical protein
MRDWIWALAPVGLVVYFVMYPAKLIALLHWIMSVA